MFFGRKAELKRLNDLWELPNYKVVVVKGRRRIGKSYFIEHFSTDFAIKNHPLKQPVRFLRFSGLETEDLETNFNKQIKNFKDELRLQKIPFDSNSNSWAEVFKSLIDNIDKNEKTVILFDEISWVADGIGNDFVPQLKNLVDKYCSNYKNLMIIICGSFSSWIEKYIEESGAFVGRIDDKILLKELTLDNAVKFWTNHGLEEETISNKDKLKVLLTMGGVPKYLSLILPKKSAEYNILRLGFTDGAFLNKEFPILFKDAFLSKRKFHKIILETLADGPLSYSELVSRLEFFISKVNGGEKTDESGHLVIYLKELEQAGFISKQQMYKIGGHESKFVFYRLSDNYSRFYLKYIEPKLNNIKTNSFSPNQSMESWPEYETIMGYQFENLVLNNKDLILDKIGIKNIKYFASYKQNSTKKQEACQIDILIEDNFRTIYLCEIKFKKEVKSIVIEDVKEKIRKLKKPKGYTIRPVLIYSGELSKTIVDSGYFHEIINFEDFL